MTFPWQKAAARIKYQHHNDCKACESLGISVIRDRIFLNSALEIDFYLATVVLREDGNKSELEIIVQYTSLDYLISQLIQIVTVTIKCLALILSEYVL